MEDLVSSDYNEQLKDVILVIELCSNGTFKDKIILTIHCATTFKYGIKY